MEDHQYLVSLLEKKNRQLEERERELEDQKEELQAQKEELTAAIEELVLKNSSLMEALQKLKQRNEELDQLLYRTSHDLKTPVSSLQGLLDLMRSEELTEVQQTLHHYMEEKVHQMDDVLKSLGMLAQAAFDTVVIEEVNIETLIKNTIRQLSYLPNFSNVDFRVDPYGVKRVRGDASLIAIILKCLVSNAINYRDGTVKGIVDISIHLQGESIIIEVTDDGEGIPSDISSKIFNMFYRGSSRSVGAGLGLYIVKSVADRLKGDVRWISRPGKTNFQIILPQFPDVATPAVAQAL